VVVNNNSANQTVTLSNSGTVNLTGITVNVTAPFSRNGGSCGTTLNAGANCTIIVRFRPTTVNTFTGSLTVTGSFAITGSPVSLTGAGIAVPAKPTFGVLDAFNRANANNLGANWTQGTVAQLGNASAIQINSNQATCSIISCLLGAITGNAYWSSDFGVKQGAAVQLVTTALQTSLTNNAVVLDATGSFNLGLYPNYILVSATGTGTVTVSTNIGGTSTSVGTLAVSPALANADILTAEVDGTSTAPTVYVWRTRGTTTTFLGAVQLDPDPLWTSGGKIGIQVPSNHRVDNFAGGNAP